VEINILYPAIFIFSLPGLSPPERYILQPQSFTVYLLVLPEKVAEIIDKNFLKLCSPATFN